MRNAVALLALSVATVFVATGDVAGRIPRPSVMQESWQLEFKFKNLVPLRLKVGGEVKLYWYLRYTVINRTGQDRTFTPAFTLYSEKGTLLQAGRNVPRQAYQFIKRRHNNPMLRSPVGMMGKLLQGEDNAKHGIAVWPDFDADSGSVDIFVGGLSGEVQEIRLPTPIRKTLKTAEGGEKVIVKDSLVLSKTLKLHFEIPGAAEARHRVTPKLTDGRWVMR
ncbi:MAG: hypothetical protein ACOC8F_08275 [Planctomycetota bacterium]